MPVQTKFRTCTIFVPGILETCQFHKKKLRLNRIIRQTTGTKMTLNSCFFGWSWHVSRMSGTEMVQIWNLV
ncbi:hypothetical protein Hanom_Chr04g00378991 [Helianthus anomalus]